MGDSTDHSPRRTGKRNTASVSARGALASHPLPRSRNTEDENVLHRAQSLALGARGRAQLQRLTPRRVKGARLDGTVVSSEVAGWTSISSFIGDLFCVRRIACLIALSSTLRGVDC